MVTDSDSLITFNDAIELLVKQLLPLLPKDIVPWIVFDRGGYDRELMARFAGNQAKPGQFPAHYIAWEQYDETDYTAFDLNWQDIGNVHKLRRGLISV